MNTNFIGFSILVCTYNGLSKLPNTLKHLDELSLTTNIDYEIIVIDNASSSDIYFELSDFLKSLKRKEKFYFFKESMSGKNYALILGIQKSKYNWIIVCDDDNWLCKDYLLVASTLIDNYPDVSIFGGKSKMVLTDSLSTPDWLNDNLLRYACGSQYPKSGYVTYRQDIWGAGSIYSKAYLEKALLRHSLILTNQRGEDSEIFYRIILLGSKAFYSDKLFFHHYLSSERLTYDNHLKMTNCDLQSQLVLEKYKYFIKYLYLNKSKKLSFIKWYFYGLLKFLGIKFITKNFKFNLMINIHTPFCNDNHLLQIKKYYNSI
jgi:glycosyltransferase involved in cell wall biosynthesis